MKRAWWESPFESRRMALVLCAALAVAVHANTLYNEFAYDDVHIVQENAGIHDLSSLPEALTSPYWPDRWGRELGLWRPAATAVYALEWRLFGNNPVAFHTVLVLLHAAVTGLVVLLLWRFAPGAPAFFGGLVFAVHPVHVEAVANVVGTAEVMSSAFYLLACLLYLRWEPDDPMPARAVVGVLLLYALAFLSKEMAVTLPGVLFLLDGARKELRIADLPGYLRRRGLVYVGTVVVAGAVLYGRQRILGSLASPFAPLGADILETIPRIWTVAGIWPHYLRLLFFPVELASDYSPALIPIYYGWNWVNGVGVAMVFLFLGLAWLSWRQGELGREGGSERAVGFGVLWFVITISPVANLVFLSGVLLAERTLYLPSVGFALAAGWVLHYIRTQRGVMALVLVATVVGAFSWRTWTRNPTWKDNLEVFDALVRDHPESGRSQWVLGDMLYDRNRLSEALKAYRAAIGFLGTEYPLMTQIGQRLAVAKQYDQAERILRFAWNEHPQYAMAPGALAIVYAEREKYEEAAEAARAAVTADPSDAVTWHLLAATLTKLDRPEEALDARLNAIRRGEGHQWQQWQWLSENHLALGDTVRALEALDSARIRIEASDAMRQIDSIRTLLQGPGSVP